MARLPLKSFDPRNLAAARAIVAHPALYRGHRAVLLTWAEEYLRRHADDAPSASPAQKLNALSERRPPRANCLNCRGTGFVIWQSADGRERAARCQCTASSGNRAA